MTPLLDGLQVIEGSAFVAAPSGGMTLAQLGADVIRFDAIGGGIDYRRWPLTRDGQSLYWAGLNKGKRSVQVDLRTEEGRDLVGGLVEAAGVFLTNFPAQGWLSYEVLANRRSDLIMVNVVGNHDGTTAVDYTVNCAVGYPLVTGPEGAPPVNHVLPAWDVICGQTAALGLLAAERWRNRTGQGQLVRLALSDVALATVGHLGHIAEAQVLGQERERLANDLYGAFGRDFVTADGERLIVVAVSGAQWRALLEATGLAVEVAGIEADTGLDLARSEGDRFVARERLFPLFERWFAAHTMDEAAAALDGHGVCWGRYRSFGQMVADDERCSTANPMFDEVDQPGIGRYLVPGSPLDFSAVPRGRPEPAPVLGQHTDEVLTDLLGLSTAELGRLHDAGIIS